MCMASFNPVVRKENEARNKLEKEEKRTRNHPKLFFFLQI